MAQSGNGAWSPPDFGNQRRTRIGASVVEQFVAGHDASDVLRELVQNEFDGGGDSLIVNFGEEALDIAGNGRGISSDGWQRLSVIVGTGRVVGEADAERVEAKRNGIGSKNFGLRSLFLFGNEIYVRSGGQVAVLDLRTLETGKVRDPSSTGDKGVRLRVPFRTETFEMLEPFTAEREQRAFDVMAEEMLATLVKLALAGRRKGLRKLTLTSERTGNMLDWRQDAKRVPCKAPGVSATMRKGALSQAASGRGSNRKRFEELEFARAIDVPAKFRARSFPAYFNAGPSRLRIAVSLPVARKRIDHDRQGFYYYPLQAPHAHTGFTVSVSAPFELNNDRSDTLENEWNTWLEDEAAELTVDLLKTDWFARFGADAYRAVAPSASSQSSRFADEVLRLLSEENCWPTRAAGQSRFAEAESVTTPAEPALDGFLDESQLLHHSFEANPEARALALRCGAKRFTISSLVRLRCSTNGANLQTKTTDDEADYSFEDNAAALRSVERQVKMAGALTAVAKRLSNYNRHDLGYSPSTLTANLTLRPARELVQVDADIWDVCPEPLDNRLHPALAECRPIASHAREFDEQQWIVDACERAREGAIASAERTALYAKLLSDGTKLGRRALAAVRESPIAKDQRGEWCAPEDMAALRGATAKLLAPIVNIPSKQIMRRPDLLKQLRIRDKINRDDLVRLAESMDERPQDAEACAKLLSENLKLVTASFADEVESVRFLRSRTGELAAPQELHLDTPANRLCLDEQQIVGGSHDLLYRKLGIREHPEVETIIDLIEAAKARGEPPVRPELLYPALVAALARERRSKDEFSSDDILWVNDDYWAPEDVLVGTLVPYLFDDAIPILRRTDAVAQAYQSLGAQSYAQDRHWTAFFEHVSESWDDGEPLSRTRKNALLDAYRLRGGNGLPEAVGEHVDCLLDRNDRLHALRDLRTELLVEGDHPALAAALEAAQSSVVTVELTDRTRPFYTALGIKPLTVTAGTGKAVFGTSAAQPFWFKPHHGERLLALLKRPLLARAVHAIAASQRHALKGYSPIELQELEHRLKSIGGVTFFDEISREYRLGGKTVRVPVEIAVDRGVIGMVAPKTKLDFQQLTAEALAELAGAENLAQMRSLSTSFLYLVLCRNNEDIRVYLERMGINHEAWEGEEDDEVPLSGHDGDDDTGEEIVRQVFEDLAKETPSPDSYPGTSRQPDESSHEDEEEGAETPEPPPPPPFVLPDLDEVELIVVPTEGQEIEPRRSQGSGGWGGSGLSTWTPRSPEEAARDAKVGRRGEELIYRMEIERVRGFGHADPEKHVVWTSSGDPGADHDIKSIDEHGNPRWIEVKATTGVDGRFDWSKKEFQKALRERDSYELWRVYKAGTAAPVTKCFRNPAELVGESKLVLELGSLRASIEGME